MATWWKVNRYAWKIEPVEVARETEHFLFIYSEYWKKNQQIAKGTEYWKTFKKNQQIAKGTEYWKTFGKARKHMLDRASQNANSASGTWNEENA